VASPSVSVAVDSTAPATPPTTPPTKTAGDKKVDATVKGDAKVDPGKTKPPPTGKTKGGDRGLGLFDDNK
jgi:hypothetical protein